MVGDYYILDDEFAFSYGEERYVDRDQITNNEERLNGEDDIMLACLLATFNCTTDNQEWNGVEYEGIGIQKMFILPCSLLVIAGAW